MKRITLTRMLLAVIMMIAAAIPQTAQAKWSKASTSFSYGGVTVKVTDRHEFVGAPYDTYGYTTYQNGNDVPVTVNWRCYGVLKNGHKLVKVNDDSFVLQPKETRNEVYSYSGGKYTHRSFEKYVVSIEVIKDKKVTETTKETTKETTTKPSKEIESKGAVNASNYDAIADRIIQHDNDDCITKKDLADGIDWLAYMFPAKIEPLILQVIAMRQRNDSDGCEKLYKDNTDLLNKWSNVGSVINSAYKNDELTEEQNAEFEDLMSQFQNYSSFF